MKGFWLLRPRDGDGKRGAEGGDGEAAACASGRQAVNTFFSSTSLLLESEAQTMDKHGKVQISYLVSSLCVTNVLIC